MLGSGAGIYVHSRGSVEAAQGPCRAWITNCFISNNSVGIGLDSYPGINSGGIGQRIHIVNNTIAWNAIGLWAGRTVQIGGFDSNSVHAPLVVNNIFDSGSPQGYIQGLSGFEGIHAEDKQVSTRAGVSVGGPGGIDFNAWEATPVPKVNLGTVSILPNWPQATAVSAVPFVGPRVDIAPYTQSPTGRPGSLYVNDIFRRSPLGGVGLEYSAHDFRLAPNVSMTLDAPGAAGPALLNPLVNQGIDGVNVIPAPTDTNLPANVMLPIVMLNQRAITGAGPGLPVSAEDVAVVHGWDWDGEGFGDPRIEARTGFAVGNPSSADFFGVIDIGADEMGELIMAGYAPNTRIYTDSLFPNGDPLRVPHDSIIYFNLIGGSPYPRPHYGYVLSEWYDAVFGLQAGYDWYIHVQSGSDISPSTANLTRAPLPTPLNHISLLSAIGAPEAMRALACDYSPALFPDPHPYWPLLMMVVSGGSLGTQAHPYAANCWYADLNVLPESLDNPFVWNNLSSPVQHSSDFAALLGWFYGNVAVADATINPPGTFAKWALGSYVLFPVGPFGAFAPCSGSPYAVGPWGYGDVAPGCPDGLPALSSVLSWGARCNCELSGGFGNLQSFLVLQHESPVDPLGMGAGLPSTHGAIDWESAMNETVSRLRSCYERLRASRRTDR